MSEISISSEALGRIWKQLNAKHRAGRSDGRRVAHEGVIEQGWGERCDIQDILWETDDRADLIARHNDDFDCLLGPYNLNFETRYRGPFSNTSEVWGHRAMRATDVAMLVMEIERLGFTVDAEPLVSALRPNLVRRKFLTNSELSVLWYQKQRHHLEPIILRVADARPTTSKTISTHSGYKAVALLQDEQPVILRIDAPKSRRGFPLKYWITAELSSLSIKSY